MCGQPLYFWYCLEAVGDILARVGGWVEADLERNPLNTVSPSL